VSSFYITRQQNTRCPSLLRNWLYAYTVLQVTGLYLWSVQKDLTHITCNTVYCIFDLGLHYVSGIHPSPLFMDSNCGLLVNALTYYKAGLAFCPTLLRC
jgi:hypothetical protein